MIEHIIVLGAGAIGSIYAAKLAGACDVTVVARREHADAINANGLRLAGLEDVTVRVRAVTAVRSIAPRTLVVLSTKVNDNRAAAESIADKVQDDTVILCVQNGLGGEDIVGEAVNGRCVVLRAITHFGAPGVEAPVPLLVRADAERLQVPMVLAVVLGRKLRPEFRHFRR